MNIQKHTKYENVHNIDERWKRRNIFLTTQHRASLSEGHIALTEAVRTTTASIAILSTYHIAVRICDHTITPTTHTTSIGKTTVAIVVTHTFVTLDLIVMMMAHIIIIKYDGNTQT
jgi:hypothetical protein